LHQGVSGHMEMSQHAVQMWWCGTEDHLRQKCQI